MGAQQQRGIVAGVGETELAILCIQHTAKKRDKNAGVVALAKRPVDGVEYGGGRAAAARFHTQLTDGTCHE